MKNNNRTFLFLFLVTTGTLTACIDDQQPFYNPIHNEMVEGEDEGEPDPPAAFKDYQLIFEDQFDGEKLNESIWKYRLGERLGGYNLKENVLVKDGRLIQQMKYTNYNGKETLTGGGVISKVLFGYGYYETKCTLFSGTGGMHSSFWSMGENGGDGENTPRFNTVYEIDGYEVDSHTPRKLTCNLNSYIGEQRGLGGRMEGDFPTDKEFVLGYEWLPTEVNWYVNGKKVLTRTNKDFAFDYAQQNVWITALANASQEHFVEKDKLPGASSWDYFRFYTVLLKGINLIGNGEFEYNQNESFALSTKKDPQYPIAWLEYEDNWASFVEYNDNAVSGRNLLKHYSDKKYKVATAHRLQYIANGVYDFEAYVMSSGGQPTSEIRISGFKGNDVKVVKIPQADAMTKIEIKGVDVQDNKAFIEIISEANAGQWILVDNVSFYATEGRDDVEPTPPFSQDLTDKVYGETVAEQPTSKQGNWQAGIGGYGKNKSLFSYNPDGTDWAEFVITAEADDTYDIRFYKVVYNGSSTSAKVKAEWKDQVVEQTWNLQQGTSGWVTLGKADLKKGDKVKVRMSGGGLLRVSALALTPDAVFKPSETLVMAIDKPNALSFGKSVTIAPSGDEILPKKENDVVYLPAKFVEQQLDISLDCADATITLDDLKRKLPESFKATYVPSTRGKDHIIIGPKEYKVTDNLDYILFSIL